MKTKPSTRWTSYEAWRYDGMDQRLEKFMALIDTHALVDHVRTIAADDSIAMSEPFSAGQFWCCFEFASMKTEQLLIARVRLPRHPDSSRNISSLSEQYAIDCEVAMMRFLHAKVQTFRFPRLFAYEGPDSNWSKKVGASYMIIEGFYGNTLQDVEFDVCKLPTAVQDHIMKQWTTAQAELAAFTFPEIGSICDFTGTNDGGHVTVGPLAVAAAESFDTAGPFTDAFDYFVALANARIHQMKDERIKERGNALIPEGDEDFEEIGLRVFKDIVETTTLFKTADRKGPFPLNHMDLGTQNILVDDDFNFLAVIDWEFAQTAPWEVNHFPMPFPLVSSDDETNSILADPSHVAYGNVVRQSEAQRLYERGFKIAEKNLAARGCPLGRSIGNTLRTPAARILGAVEKIGVFNGMEEELTYEIVRLAYDLQGDEATAYIDKFRRRT